MTTFARFTPRALAGLTAVCLLLSAGCKIPSAAERRTNPALQSGSSSADSGSIDDAAAPAASRPAGSTMFPIRGDTTKPVPAPVAAPPVKVTSPSGEVVASNGSVLRLASTPSLKAEAGADARVSALIAALTCEGAMPALEGDSGDTLVTREEFLKTAESLAIAPTAANFAAVDTDGDGKVQPAELCDIVTRIVKALTASGAAVKDAAPGQATGDDPEVKEDATGGVVLPEDEADATDEETDAEDDSEKEDDGAPLPAWTVDDVEPAWGAPSTLQ